MNLNVEWGPDAAAQLGPRIYEDAIPAFARHELERLYQSPYASAEGEHVRQPGTHTYVALNGAAVAAVILFRVRGDGVQVLNAAVELDGATITGFAACIFERYPAVRSIALRSVAVAPSGCPYPSQRYRMSEDIVLALPPTVAAYHQRLGKPAAKRLEYVERRLRRDFPGFRHQVFERAAIEHGVLQALFALKQRQSAYRQEPCGLDAAQMAWLSRVATPYGFVTVSTIDGRICAGAIGTRVGDDYFLHVVTHDPALDGFSLGIANSYLTICAAIERGGRDFHFLWGPSPWKFRLLGTERALYDMVLYRSRLACVLCMPTVLGASGRAWRRRAKTGLQAAAARYRPVARVLRPCIAGWRRLRRAAPRQPAMGPPACADKDS